jgi:predicted RNA polymerase sigma factor
LTGRPADELADVWRREAPHVLGALARRYGDFNRCEDAVQEALLAAATQWPDEGLPDNPRGWLIRVASRRLVDGQRRDGARTRRETDGAREPSAGAPVEADTLELLVLCGHPALTRASQVALTLRAVGGLSTAQIAAAFLVPESTMAQRISRAKATLRAAGARFSPVGADELPDRLAGVCHVLYLIFNEGYAASAGPALLDVSLTREAIRVTRELHRVSDDPEVAGLLALMLLTDARRPARTDADGELVPLERQDRTRWDAGSIAEGVQLLSATLPRGPVGPYQIQAAIAAVHDEAPTWAGTDWVQITMLYRMLEQAAPSPVVTLNAAVAVGMAHGPEAGLAHLQPLLDQPALRRHHRLPAVRGHLLELAGRTAEAAEAYALSASLTASIPEQRYLHRRAQACAALRS